MYKKHDTLRYVTFLCTKILTLYKNQDNFRYVFIFKIRTLCVTQFFIEFLKLDEWGGYFYMQKTMHSALYFYMQKTMDFVLRFSIQKY